MSENKILNFQGVEELKSYVTPGIHEATIVSIVTDTQNEKDFIGLNLKAKNGSFDHTERFYTSSEKGMNVTVQRIRHMIKNLFNEEVANKVYSIEELNKLLAGVTGRWKFTGEEYQSTKDPGKTGIKVQLAYSNFVEPISVKSYETKLSFDPSRDIKRLPDHPMKDDKQESSIKVDEKLF
jgi:hypothetical protein